MRNTTTTAIAVAANEVREGDLLFPGLNPVVASTPSRRAPGVWIVRSLGIDFYTGRPYGTGTDKCLFPTDLVSIVAR